MVLRKGNAGSNTADDHVTAGRLALAQIPGHLHKQVPIRTDSGGGTHGFLDWVASRRLTYSIGFNLTDDICAAIGALPKDVWECAYDADRQVRDGAWVAELTGMLDLTSWPKTKVLIDFSHHDGRAVAPDESGITQGIAPSATLAEKIEWLIQNMWPADAPPPKNNVDTAAAITAATGEEISSTTVWKLRTGRQDNPQFRTLTALATFFGVPIGYFGFATESAPIDDDLTLKALRRALSNGTIRPEALRAFIDIPAEFRRLVDEMIIAAARAVRAGD